MVPIHVGRRRAGSVVRGLRRMHNLDGFVVTVPHKTAMPALCDELTPAATRIGAVNVVHRTPDGRLVGGMLDGDGFVAGLRRAGIEPAGRSVYLAGAGGAASAIAFALAQAGVTRLTIANRSVRKGVRVVEPHRPELPAPGARRRQRRSVAATISSSTPRRSDCARATRCRWMSAAGRRSQTVAEIIMHPAETPCCARRAAKGCRVHFGAPMLASQIEFDGGIHARDHLTVKDMEAFDYVVVGGGTAGCILANRLTASGRHACSCSKPVANPAAAGSTFPPVSASC